MADLLRHFYWWLLRLLGIGQKPKLVENLTLEIEMARATVTWGLPTERVGGAPLERDEILHAEISMSADGGENFGDRAEIPADDPQIFVVDDLQPGIYTFRVVVVDRDLRRSANADASAQVRAAPEAVSDLRVEIQE